MRRSLLLLPLLVGFASDAARAASITVPFGFCCGEGVTGVIALVEGGPGPDTGVNFDGNGNQIDFDLPVFDDALGTYLGFQIDIAGSYRLALSVEAPHGQPAPPGPVAVAADVRAGGGAGVSGPGYSIGLVSLAPSDTIECAGDPGCSDSHGVTVPFSASTGVQPYAPPTSVGFAGSLALHVSREAGATYPVLARASFFWSGPAAITFFYEPIPEPGTALLLGMGVVAIGVGRRRYASSPASRSAR